MLVGETATLDETVVDPCELFVAIGMLVLESRLPTASVKGRRDGLHCPQAVGHWSSHECELTQSQVTPCSLLYTTVFNLVPVPERERAYLYPSSLGKNIAFDFFETFI